jgi:nucleotide-binding universal stress UspA family protein
MGKYRKLLVAIDGSEISMHALRESFKLARAEKSWITVLSVIPRYEGDLGAVWIDNIRESMKKPCAMALSEAEKMAKEEGVVIRTVCEEGEIFERIVDFADAENCDLIVMGRKGTGRLERTLIGSVTSRVIGHSHRDVLVFPEGSEFGWKKFLLATDGSKYSDAATNRAIDFAKSYGGTLSVVSVVDIPPEFYSQIKGLEAAQELIRKAQEFVNTVKKKAEEQDVKAEILVKEGEAAKIITDLAVEQKSDVVIIGSHGRTGLRRLLMGSTAERVIGNAACPVLIATA